MSVTLYVSPRPAIPSTCICTRAPAAGRGEALVGQLGKLRSIGNRPGGLTIRRRLATQCHSFFPRPDTCKNRGTEIDERDHAKTRLCVERLERPALPAEIAGQKTSGIGLATCPTSMAHAVL